jgi:hypothetical protein
VAGQLERIGHDVTLWAPVQGMMADVARDSGLRVARAESDLPDVCDAILAQDAPTLLIAAERYPAAARALVIHGAETDLHFPPPPEGAAAVVVALNDATARRARAIAGAPPVVRLRQPIDTVRFRPRGNLRATPERVLFLGNDLVGPRRDALVEVCADAGLTVSEIGQHGTLVADPVAEICAADIVIGRGRSLLEAMSCGRAAYVLGPWNGDGWVTAQSYPIFESDGFRGWATDEVPDAPAFAGALADYHHTMGDLNRALVSQHHRFYEHATELSELLADIEPRPLPDAPLRELARLVRLAYQSQARVNELGNDLHQAHLHGNALAADLAAARREREELEAERDRLRRELDTIASSRRWLVARAISRPVDRLRASRR